MNASSAISPASQKTMNLPDKSETMLENLSQLSLRSILPTQTERALFVGRTGSGKTLLSERMLRYFPFVAVLDMKRRLDWEGYEVHERLEPLSRSEHTHLIYKPSWQEQRPPKGEYWSSFIEEFFRWVYERGNTVTYVDEVMRCTHGDDMPEYYHALTTTGRELYLPVWSATQRPKKIPQVLLSETEHFMIFDLQLAQDEERMEEVSEVRLPSRKWHEFVYVKRGDRIARKLLLVP